MLVELAADFPVTDAACKQATGRRLRDWFDELESRTEFHQKRREAVQWLYTTIGGTDAWWPATIWVEYERHKGIVNKKDGRMEGSTNGFKLDTMPTASAGLGARASRTSRHLSNRDHQPRIDRFAATWLTTWDLHSRLNPVIASQLRRRQRQ